jgi:hypothetical protein
VSQSDFIYGRVYLWGRLIECKHGWRAQYAYPAEFWTDQEDMKNLANYYGVPVRILKPKKLHLWHGNSLPYSRLGINRE